MPVYSEPEPSPIPVLHCRGTHYEVGFRIGFAFQNMIQELLGNWKYFNDVVLKLGLSEEGKDLIKSTLKLCSVKYPGYISEIQGMADGAGIDFEKLFMLNIDSMLCTLSEDDPEKSEEIKKLGGTGCTTLICNKDEAILGHTEDALSDIKDHVYIISAEILSGGAEDNESIVLEKFTTLCYAGTLMGYTMGYNNHGMIYSVNTIFPTVNTAGTTPRAFIARSLLGASDLPSLLNVLKDKGNGVADGFSVNVYFYPEKDNSKRVFYNIEVAPPKTDDNARASIVDVHMIQPGTVFTHCNRYLRVKSTECNPTALIFSDKRSSVVCENHGEPACEHNVRDILSDETDYHYPIYNNGKENKDEEYEMSFIRTVAIGIFNINHKTWSVYTGAPKYFQPVHTFTIE